MQHPRLRHLRPAFTIIELSVVLLIIVLLVGILLVGLNQAIKSTRLAGETQALRSISMAVEQFKSEFEFLPPVIDDAAPVDPDGNLNVRSLVQLEDHWDDALDARVSSQFSLAVFLLGSAQSRIDGIDGLGFTKPRSPGPKRPGDTNWICRFSRQGGKFEPKLDTSKGRPKVAVDPSGTGVEVRLLDRWGNAIRYARWVNFQVDSKSPINYGIPPSVFPSAAWKEIAKDVNRYFPMTDPVKREAAQVLAAQINPELRSAEFAITSSGPDGEIFDPLSDPVPPSEEELRRKIFTNIDNLVEIGQ